MIHGIKDHSRRIKKSDGVVNKTCGQCSEIEWRMIRTVYRIAFKEPGRPKQGNKKEPVFTGPLSAQCGVPERDDLNKFLFELVVSFQRDI